MPRRFPRPPVRATIVFALLACVALSWQILSISGAGAVAAPRAAATTAHASASTSRATAARGRHAVQKLIWGPATLPNGASAFPVYHQLGVQVFQIDLSWAQSAPSRPANAQDPNDPAYTWPAQLDQVLSEASRYRIKVMLLVQGSPAWANGNRSSVWAPDDAQDYADFLAAAAKRYPTVHLWMVWGEPNRDESPDFEPMPPNKPTGPRRYALLLDAGYHALKSVSRANIVIGGDTWSFGLVEPADFVRWMRLPNGRPPALDYYGHNPFGRRFPNLRDKPYFPGGLDINDIDTLESQLRGIYHRNVKLWLSEFTISSDHNTSAFDFHVSRKAQARWLRAAFRLANSVNYVSGLGWFSLLDAPPAKGSLTNGLMTWSLKHKPAFAAYEHAR